MRGLPIISRMWIVARCIDCVAALLLVAQTSPVDADERQQDLVSRLGFGQFVHRHWSASDGAPLGILAIAQTPDGYLWLGSAQGLYRFDGVTFERMPGPSGSPMERASVASLHVTRSGTLWVGFRQYGGVGVVRGGRLYDMRLPDPEENITLIAETADGAVWPLWAGYRSRFQRYHKGRWEIFGDRFGLSTDEGFTSLCGTSDGTLWIALYKWDGTSRLAYLPPGARRLKPSKNLAKGVSGLVSDPDGGVWFVAPDQFQPANQRFGLSRLGAATLAGMACRWKSATFDGEGRLWTIRKKALFYRPDAQSLSATNSTLVGPADGMISLQINIIAKDREGSIWVGTEQGLEQFRPAKAFREPVQMEGEWSIAAATDGIIYVNAGSGVYRAMPGGSVLKIWNGKASTHCAGRDRDMWLFVGTRLLHWRGGRFEEQRAFSDGSEVLMCAEDGIGRLWVTLDGSRVGWRDAQGWHLTNLRAEWWDLAITPGGDLAFKTIADLVRVRGNKAVTTRLARYDAGALSMIRSGIRDLFLSGSRALLRVRGDRITRLDGTRFPWVTQLRDLVQAPTGETWLIGQEGLSRVSTAALDRAFENPDAPLVRTLFNVDDGIESPTQAFIRRGHHAEAGGDGRIWFLNQLGLSFIAPSRLNINRLPPPVAIRQLSSGGQTYVDPDKLTLPAGTRSLDIAYTALSLVVPNRIQFRYRLEGVDDDWVNPGTRRAASYSNLGPGTYRFQVIASNDDGVWNRQGAALDFEIRPTFFESWPFRLLCGLALLGLLWLAYSLRLHTVANRIRARAAERLDERERIARELHDTLLQSVQALTLRFQLAIDHLPRKEPALPVLEAAIDQADRLIAEGRDRVRDLRTVADGDVEQMLCDIVARQNFGPDVDIAIGSSGTPRQLDQVARDEIVRVASEAIFNIRRHADADRIAIGVDYGRNLTLRFTDNGVGIDSDTLSSGVREGHFGLTGMRERARKLCGDLAIGAPAGGGAELVLTVSGRIAYKRGERRLFARFRRPG